MLKTKNRKTIGVMGSNQIQHIIPLLEKEYKVINLQENWNRKATNISKLARFLKEINDVDIVYNVFTSPYFWKKARIANYFGKKVVTHWIGTDARYTDEGKVDFTKLSYIDIHLSCFQAITDQLARHEIKTVIIPIVPFNLTFDLASMPKKHSVLIYMPKGVEQDYGYTVICGIFALFPNLEFNIVANDDKSKFSAYPNVKVLGRLTLDEMEKLYNKISIVIRIHVNDGLSMSVLEALAKGKKVIWNYEFPFCLPGRTKNEIAMSLRKILTEDLKKDVEAHNFIAKEYSQEIVLNKYKKIFE